MATIESQMEHKTPEELKEIVNLGREKFTFTGNGVSSADDIRQMFEYLHAVLALGLMEADSRIIKTLAPSEYREEETRILEGMKTEIDRFMESGQNPGQAVDFLIDWAFVAIRPAEDGKTFRHMPIYLELFNKLSGLPPELGYKRARVLLQMGIHYNIWLNLGGDTDQLSDEEYELLTTAFEQFEAQAKQLLEQYPANQNHDGAISLLRNLARYNQMISNPNEAIAYLKRLPEILPLGSKYHPTEVAEVNLEIGKIFLEFKKYPTAKKYFTLAHSILREQGPEWEMMLVQVESYLEECDH